MPRPKTYEVDPDSTPLGGGAGGGGGGGDSSGFRVADRTKEGSKEKETSKREAEERAFLSQVQRDVGKIIRKEECTEFMKQNEVHTTYSDRRICIACVGSLFHTLYYMHVQLLSSLKCSTYLLLQLLPLSFPPPLPLNVFTSPLLFFSLLPTVCLNPSPFILISTIQTPPW